MRESRWIDRSRFRSRIGVLGLVVVLASACGGLLPAPGFGSERSSRLEPVTSSTERGMRFTLPAMPLFSAGSTLGAGSSVLALDAGGHGSGSSGGHDAVSGEEHVVHWSSSRPDGHAPLGVMGDHAHEAGEWMFSNRFMFMEMDGNRDGTSGVSDSEVLSQFPVTPTSMSMEMHMIGVMHAPTDRLTLMAMLPFLRLAMDHKTRAGARFTTRSDGPGDFKLSGLVTLARWENQSLLLNAGMSLPTGSIDEDDDTPAGPNTKLPLSDAARLGNLRRDARPHLSRPE